jgi:hypothetical protein
MQLQEFVLFQRKAKGIPVHVTEVMERLEGAK